MPSHTIPSAFIKFFEEEDPWQWPTWQAITGMKHGLFPDDDADLPEGLNRRDLIDISSFFAKFYAISGEDAKITFCSSSKGGVVVGRTKWKDWIINRWAHWNIHARITKVMIEQDLHPTQIMNRSKNRSKNQSKQEKWPGGHSYIPLFLDDVALDLFGEEATDADSRLSEELRAILQHLIQRTWFNLKNQYTRNRKSLDTLEEAATAAFEDLDRDQPTKAKISALIRTVAKWKGLAELYELTDVLKKIGVMEDELKGLMEGLGAKVKRTSKTPRTCKVTTKMLESLASKEDVGDLLSLYTEFFDTPSDEPPIISEAALDIAFGDVTEGADAGIGSEAMMTPEALAHRLGFPRGLPLSCNRYRHKGGLSPWIYRDYFEVEKNPALEADLDLITPHWHQLAGVHAIIRARFSAEPDPNACTGTLVADDVGLGKTFQAILIITFFAGVVILQQKNLPLPPIIAETPFLGGHRVRPGFSHIIVVPITLVAQWENELHINLRPGSFDIFLYPSTRPARRLFWADDGPYHSSNHDASNRILIVTYSALGQDFQDLYKNRAKGCELPWALPPRQPKYDQLVKNTVYGQSFLSGFFDELHDCRNIGPRHFSVVLLAQRVHFVVGQTATPLQTSTKDVAAMGRIIGLEHFLSEAAYEEEKVDVTNLRKARGTRTDDYTEPTDNNDDPVRLCQVTIAQRMQKQFENHLLRRTVSSKNWLDKPLIDLPPFERIPLLLTLTPREMSSLQKKAESVKDSVSTANGTQSFCTRSFYNEYRMDVAVRPRPSAEIPTFETLEDWEPVKSTKMDVAARICRHLLERDDAPPVFAENGQVVFPPMPPTLPGQTPSQSRKILIYQEFPSLGPLFRNVLKLYGVKCYWIDGNTSYANRASTINNFRTKYDVRVFIFSSIGSTGLNLSCANTIIFLDQPWSAQDERQIRGRAHRQPQKDIVRIYPLLGIDTIDIFLSWVARGKQDMADAFLSKADGDELYQLLSGNVIIGCENDADETLIVEDPGAKSAKSKANKKASKAKGKKAIKSAATVDDEMDIDEPDGPVGTTCSEGVIKPKEGSKKKASGAKGKEAIKPAAIDEDEMEIDKPDGPVDATPSEGCVAGGVTTDDPTDLSFSEGDFTGGATTDDGDKSMHSATSGDVSMRSRGSTDGDRPPSTPPPSLAAHAVTPAHFFDNYRSSRERGYRYRPRTPSRSRSPSIRRPQYSSTSRRPQLSPEPISRTGPNLAAARVPVSERLKGNIGLVRKRRSPSPDLGESPTRSSPSPPRHRPRRSPHIGASPARPSPSPPGYRRRRSPSPDIGESPAQPSPSPPRHLSHRSPHIAASPARPSPSTPGYHSRPSPHTDTSARGRSLAPHRPSAPTKAPSSTMSRPVPVKTAVPPKAPSSTMPNPPKITAQGTGPPKRQPFSLAAKPGEKASARPGSSKQGASSSLPSLSNANTKAESGSSRQRSIIPRHREPSSFEPERLSPPPPTITKVFNPFSKVKR